jgi:hypothetical protein
MVAGVSMVLVSRVRTAFNFGGVFALGLSRRSHMMAMGRGSGASAGTRCVIVAFGWIR